MFNGRIFLTHEGVRYLRHKCNVSATTASHYGLTLRVNIKE